MKDDSEIWQEYRLESFPSLESTLALDGLTLSDLLKLPRHVWYYTPNRQGWLEEISYSTFILTVLVHGKKNFKFNEVKKWIFSPSSGINDPDFEVWTYK